MPNVQDPPPFVTIDPDNGALSCPVCGDANGLHHASVRVFVRDGEDSGGLVTTVGHDGIDVDPLVPRTGFPGRRDTVEIAFWCELHGNERNLPYVLRVMQHKGMTLCTWERQDAP